MPAKTYEEEEIAHLRKVLSAASDVARAECDRDFARDAGGLKSLRVELRKVVWATEHFIDENTADGA